MDKINLHYLVPFIFCFIFCSKMEEENPYPTEDVEFIVNGDTCPGTSWSIVDPGFQRSYQIMFNKDGYGEVGYDVSFSGVPRDPGMYLISEDSFPNSFLATNRGGDVILAFYHPLAG